MTTDPVTLFLDAVASGLGIPADLYAPGAVLDATVPNWRLEAHGPAAIAGTPMAAHQAHVLDVTDGRITHQDVWCGGRWEAALQAEIEAGLTISRVAVYKNIRAAALDDVVGICHELTRALNQALRDDP